MAASEDVAFALTVGELIAGPHFAEEILPVGRDVANFLEDVIAVHEGGSGTLAASRLGVSKSSLSGWIHRKHLPSLTQSIRIATAYGVPLSDVLTGEGGRRKDTLLCFPLPKTSFHRNLRVSKTPSEIEEQLRLFINQTAPPSVSEAARIIGTSARELQRLFPEMAHTLAEKHARWRSQVAERKREDRLVVVRELVNQMVREGVTPTIARLERRLVGIPKSFLLKQRVECKRMCENAKFGFLK